MTRIEMISRERCFHSRRHDDDREGRRCRRRETTMTTKDISQSTGKRDGFWWKREGKNGWITCHKRREKKTTFSPSQEQNFE